MFVEYMYMHPSSRVWVYQANEELSDEQVENGQDLIRQFVENWTSHNAKLDAYGGIFHKRFLVFLADQRNITVGGCSQDTLTRFVTALEKNWGIPVLDRMVVAYRDSVQSPVKTLPLDQLKSAYEQGIIHDNTLVYDNLVDTREKLDFHWLKPLKDSWHKRFL